MTAPAVFELIDISYAYHGRIVALHDVDLTIQAGEALVVLGPNGSGKSTLLKVLDGLYRPSSGRLLAFGRDVTRAADDPELGYWLHRRVGLVFQEPDVQLFSPTVFDDVAFGPLQLGWPAERVREAVQRVLEELDLAHLADRAPFELSGGEKKRVALATVLVMEPEVILLDEPTANLDPRSRAHLIDLLATLHQRGHTLVIATHELDLAALLATRVVVFGEREHRPVAEGTPDEILTDHELLLATNLVHDHPHRHGPIVHSHPHWHDAEHQHDHGTEHET
ncbi:ABC transporter ATP-binding protein [Thermomicrobium sp. 4228-Ro]|uniref:energy-coupling factor ABC transporter ATP-binding protein n=1 Tax=Thermomicrobium sp. 4228-Ro TaxID=2993937 RepID=UPI00224928F0|nr:ABC transporter ATP-binding protein [Thermomicrobium sp. 4228-Ro]MCX2727767.1 ABC transporter ATP-binding protein [Thermomicrobium sp. 4228-Ro]